jgi:hypothetical protein
MKTVLDVLNDRIQQQLDAATTTLVGGASADFAAYKELCGLIRGLRTAQMELQDLAKNLRENDD